jgi:hypothetical protein
MRLPNPIRPIRNNSAMTAKEIAELLVELAKVLEYLKNKEPGAL